MKIKKQILSAALILLSLSPAAAKKVKTQSYRYTLPRTVLSLSVESVQKEIIPGIYASYAENLLNLKLPQKDSSHFEISKISISSHTERDYSHYFEVELTAEQKAVFDNLVKEGLILPFGSPEEGISEVILPVHDKNTPALPYKTKSSQAAKAAQRIAQFREDRYNIVIGNTDASYSGEALGAALEELKTAEKELLELFLPIERQYSYSCSFDFIPANGSNRFEAFCFSEDLGVLPAGSPEGHPYVLEIKVEEVPAREIEIQEEVPVLNYRIPAYCTVTLYLYEHVVCHLRIPVCQLGKDEKINI